MVQIVGDRSIPYYLLHKDEKPERKRAYILVVPAGAKAGYVSAVMLWVLSEHGLNPEQFRIVLGTSAGFINVVAFCARQSELTPAVYEHLANKPWFFPTGGVGGWLTLHHYLEGILTGAVFPDVRLDITAVQACSAQKLSAVSDLRGQIRYHDLTEVDTFTLMHASSAILPFAAGRSIGGKVAIDGAYAHAHCQFARTVRTTIREVGPDTDVCVLFVGNRVQAARQHWLEPWVYGAGMCASLWWSPWLLSSALAIDRKIARSERIFEKPVRSRARVCAFFPEDGEKVDPWEWNPSFMRDQGRRMSDSLSRVLERL